MSLVNIDQFYASEQDYVQPQTHGSMRVIDGISKAVILEIPAHAAKPCPCDGCDAEALMYRALLDQAEAEVALRDIGEMLIAEAEPEPEHRIGGWLARRAELDLPAADLTGKPAHQWDHVQS